MAAPPPNPALEKRASRPATPLNAVFRRIGNDPPSALPPVPPPPSPAPSSPQLLGFAEPVAQVPPIEDFLPPLLPPPPEPLPPAVAQAEIPAPASSLEPEPMPEASPEPEPPSEWQMVPEPAGGAEVRPAPERARVGELPPIAVPSPPLPRPQNLVGRLGRRLGEAPQARQPPPAPSRFEPLSPAPSPPPEARRAPQPAPKLTTPPPTPSAERRDERGGRPSLPRNRRLYRRAKLPAELEIDGVPCTLIDVSIGGFAATGVPQLEPNALVPVMIRLVIDGIEVGTLLKARIVYVTQGRSAGRFVDLSPSQMAFLRYIVTWRGESVGAVGTTTLLDAIATGPDRGFAPGGVRSEYEPKSRWWAGLIGKKVNPPR